MSDSMREELSERGSLQRSYHTSLSRKMRRSITKVKRIIHPMADDSSEEEGDEVARRLHLLPKETLASLTCRTGFSRDEVRRLYRAFKQQCPTGILTTKNLALTYARLFPLGDSRKYAGIVFNNFDEDKDGIVSFGDLLTGFASILKGDMDQKLSWIFGLYDLNGDGCISKHEMTTGISAIYEMVRNAQVLDCAIESHVNRLFDKMDLNQDGVISRDEFLDCCKNDQVIYNQLSNLIDDVQY